jgi:hypothetical protein
LPRLNRSLRDRLGDLLESDRPGTPWADDADGDI